MLMKEQSHRTGNSLHRHRLPPNTPKRRANIQRRANVTVTQKRGNWAMVRVKVMQNERSTVIQKAGVGEREGQDIHHEKMLSP